MYITAPTIHTDTSRLSHVNSGTNSTSLLGVRTSIAAAYTFLSETVYVNLNSNGNTILTNVTAYNPKIV